MKIAALAGGVGGAKLAHGLAQLLPPEDLTIIVNTGDDFEHLGLYISPDLDTVCYTLAGIANPETGWGRANESWNAVSNIERLGGPAWFRLGDNDLATHIERTRRLKAGQRLSKITSEFCKSWGIKHKVIPMSDAPVRTMVATEEGELPFQEYFVHRRCEPRVKGFKFEGVQAAEPAPGAEEAIRSADKIIFCPSNPWVSIDPILKVIGKIEKTIVAVSPIIGGEAVKGPAAKMFRELGIEPSALAVAEHYRTILTGFVLDNTDEKYREQVEAMKIQTYATDTLMKSINDRVRLAKDTLRFAGSL
jgi:LPPG:FO 2-phospho-L-lactate transferase